MSDNETLNVQTRFTIADELRWKGFEPHEITSLLYLRQWYQSGGSDRAEVVRYWEYLRLLVQSGRMEV